MVVIPLENTVFTGEHHFCKATRIYIQHNPFSVILSLEIHITLNSPIGE